MKSTNKNTYASDVLGSKKVVLVDVWAPWCGPCRAMEPILEDVEKEVGGWADIIKLDASVEMEQVQELGVQGLPTFLVYKDGKIVDSTVGMTSKANLLSMLGKYQ